VSQGISCRVGNQYIKKKKSLLVKESEDLLPTMNHKKAAEVHAGCRITTLFILRVLAYKATCRCKNYGIQTGSIGIYVN
jgi:hypothetical protein